MKLPGIIADCLFFFIDLVFYCTLRWNFIPISDFLLPTCLTQYLHSHGMCLQWSIRKVLQLFSNERHWSRDGKIDIDFFDFLGDFHRLSINIRIEIHLFLFALGNERTLVTCKSLRSARFTRDQCPFISQCEWKKCTSILKYLGFFALLVLITPTETNWNCVLYVSFSWYLWVWSFQE